LSIKNILGCDNSYHEAYQIFYMNQLNYKNITIYSELYITKGRVMYVHRF